MIRTTIGAIVALVLIPGAGLAQAAAPAVDPHAGDTMPAAPDPHAGHTMPPASPPAAKDPETPEPDPHNHGDSP